MASLVGYLQRLTTLELIASQTIKSSQVELISAETALLECERNIVNISTLPSNACVFQSIGQQLWKISTTGGVTIESVIYLDEVSGISTRLSWRQAFKE
jgi:hypothetical protein